MDDVEWIREGLRRSGKSRAALAQALGRAPSAITSLLGPDRPSRKTQTTEKRDNQTKPRQLKSHEISIIANFLGVDAPDLQGIKRVPVTFARQEPFGTSRTRDVEAEGAYEIDVNRLDADITSALIFHVDNMAGIEPGPWLVCHGEDLASNIEEAIGKSLLVLYLEDGQIVVGTARPSRYEGLFDIFDFFQKRDLLAREVRRASVVLSFCPPPWSKRYLVGMETTSDP